MHTEIEVLSAPLTPLILAASFSLNHVSLTNLEAVGDANVYPETANREDTEHSANYLSAPGD